VVKIYDDMSNDDLIDLMLKRGGHSDGRSALGPTQSRDALVVPRVETKQNTLMDRRGRASKAFDFASILKPASIPITAYYTTETGSLFEGDCLNYLPKFKANLADTVFADPPFNLGKTYGNRTDDSRADNEYVACAKAGWKNVYEFWFPVVPCLFTISRSGASFWVPSL
jgi:hypothetical protein